MNPYDYKFPRPHYVIHWQSESRGDVGYLVEDHIFWNDGHIDMTGQYTYEVHDIQDVLLEEEIQKLSLELGCKLEPGRRVVEIEEDERRFIPASHFRGFLRRGYAYGWRRAPAHKDMTSAQRTAALDAHFVYQESDKGRFYMRNEEGRLVLLESEEV